MFQKDLGHLFDVFHKCYRIRIGAISNLLELRFYNAQCQFVIFHSVYIFIVDSTTGGIRLKLILKMICRNFILRGAVILFKSVQFSLNRFPALLKISFYIIYCLLNGNISKKPVRKLCPCCCICISAMCLSPHQFRDPSFQLRSFFFAAFDSELQFHQILLCFGGIAQCCLRVKGEAPADGVDLSEDCLPLRFVGL